MVETHHPDAPLAEEARGHESAGVHTRIIALWGLALVVLIGVSLGLMYWLTTELTGRQARDTAPRRTMLEAARAAEPRIEPNQALEMRMQRETETDVLNSHGWVDREEEIVHLEIERAMRIMTERRLPPFGNSKDSEEAPAAETEGEE